MALQAAPKKTKPSETGSFCMQYQYHLHCYRTKNHLQRILPPKIYIFDTAETPFPQLSWLSLNPEDWAILNG